MKLHSLIKNSLLALGIAVVPLAPAAALCPTDDDGLVDVESIRSFITDPAGDVSSSPFFWDDTDGWGSTGDEETSFSVNQADWLNVKEAGVCIDSDDNIVFNLEVEAPAGSYKDPGDGFFYYLGEGDIDEFAANPADFTGRVVLHLADADKIDKKKAVNKYFVVAEYDNPEGSTVFETGLPLIMVYKSATKIKSEKEFDKVNFNPSRDELVAVLSEDEDDSEEEMAQLSGGDGSDFPPFDDDGEDGTEGEELPGFDPVLPYLTIQHSISEFTSLTTLSGRSNVLVRISTETFSFDEETGEAGVGSSVDKTKTARINIRSGKKVGKKTGQR